MAIPFVTRLLHRGKRFLWNYFPLRNFVSRFLLNVKKVLLMAGWGAFVILTSSSSIRMPRSQQSYFSRSSYTRQEVHKPTYQLKTIKLAIDQKRLDSVRSWKGYIEADKRILNGSRLVLLDQAADRSLSDRVFLNEYLKTELCIRQYFYDSFCRLATELSNLDEREFLLTGAQNMGPVNNNPNGSLHIHRRSQVPGIRLNFQQQTDRTVPSSGSGNPLIVPGEEHVFLPPWQDPPGLV